jgi:hypothetical protein
MTDFVYFAYIILVVIVLLCFYGYAKVKLIRLSDLLAKSISLRIADAAWILFEIELNELRLLLPANFSRIFFHRAVLELGRLARELTHVLIRN